MGWIFSLALGESLSLSANGSDPLPTAKLTNTRKVCCSQEWQTVAFLLLQSGTTLKHSEGQCFPTLTSFTEGSPARTSVLQGMEKAWKESAADYSSRSSDSLARFDRDLSSWKTCQQSLLEDSEQYSGKWPRYGMTVDGVFYPLTTWARRTDEKDGGCWPTPTVQDSDHADALSGGVCGKQGEKMSNPKLAEMAQKSGNLWQTQAQAYKFLEDAYQLGVTDGLKEGLSCPGKEIEEAYERGRRDENEECAKLSNTTIRGREKLRSRMKEKK